jgi:hypothetical protein
MTMNIHMLNRRYTLTLDSRYYVPRRANRRVPMPRAWGLEPAIAAGVIAALATIVTALSACGGAL